MSDGPQIQIDDDWKAQARAEKEKLAEQAKAKQPPASTPVEPVASPRSSPASAPANTAEDDQPPIDFKALVSSIASQAMLYLGMLPDPMSGQRMVGFEQARQQMDLLAVLEAKTTGNLSEEEGTMLASMIYRLREQYVRVVMQMRPIPDNA